MSGTALSPWDVRWPTGTVAERHGLLDPIDGRAVLVHRVDRPTMVLGAAQRGVVVRGGIDVVRRRSGGGAVLLRPGEVVWVDLLVPRGDRLWEDDVGRSAWWVGEVWRAALADLGVNGTVHRGALDEGRWGGLVCFAGRGPGEILVGGRKVVGISQRRDRSGARFQCTALLAWPTDVLVDLLGLTPADEALRDLAAAATPVGVDPDELVGSLLSHLP